jgi:hypothetical protein
MYAWFVVAVVATLPLLALQSRAPARWRAVADVGVLVALAMLYLCGPLGRWVYTRRSWRAIGAHRAFEVEEPSSGPLDEPSYTTDVAGRRVVVRTPAEWVLPQPNRVVVEASLAERGVPWLEVRSTGRRDRWGSDVETGDEAFDGRFRVRTADRVFARTVLTAEVRAALVALGPFDRVVVEDDAVRMTFGGRVHDPAEARRHAEAVAEVAAAVAATE